MEKSEVFPNFPIFVQPFTVNAIDKYTDHWKFDLVMVLDP